MADDTQAQKDLDYRVAQLEDQVDKLKESMEALQEHFGTFLAIMLAFMDNPKVKEAFQLTPFEKVEQVQAAAPKPAPPKKAVPKPGPPKSRPQP